MNQVRTTLTAWLARLVGRCKVVPGSIAQAHAPALGDATDFAEYQNAYDRGVALLQSEAYDAAIRQFEHALAIRHDAAPVHYQLGLALMRLGRLEEAGDSFVLATCFDTSMVPAYYALALVEDKQGKLDQALESIDRALRIESGNADANNLRGALLVRSGDLDAARQSFERAIASAPEHARAHSNLGYILFRDFGEYELGAEHIERALALDPGNARFECNFSMVLAHRGELDATIELCDRLLAADPSMDEARLNRGLALLKLGRFDRAWEDYEARKVVRSNYVARDFAYPHWQNEDLAGKTVLAFGEQGIGDEIMFASCFGELIGRAAHCVIECSPRLETLFRRSFPTAIVRRADSSESLGVAVDFQVAAGSLPRRLRRARPEFPAHDGYLVADPAVCAMWRARLAALGRELKIGLSWRGGMLSTRRALRSMQLAELRTLLRVPGCSFIDLQYGDTADERAAVLGDAGVTLHRWPDAITDLDQCAALIDQLDVVISVCTAVVHLAGALGRPTWVMVPSNPEWRYLHAGDAMPWYPSARLFRQQHAGDWSPVVAEIERSLAALVDSQVSDARRELATGAGS